MLCTRAWRLLLQIHLLCGSRGPWFRTPPPQAWPAPFHFLDELGDALGVAFGAWSRSDFNLVWRPPRQPSESACIPRRPISDDTTHGHDNNGGEKDDGKGNDNDDIEDAAS